MLEKNGKSATFVADVFVPTKIKSYNFVVHLDFMKYLPTKYCPVEELMDGGIAVAHLYYKEISTDDGDFSSGIAPLFAIARIATLPENCRFGRTPRKSSANTL